VRTPEGCLAVCLAPLSLYVHNGTGWVLLLSVLGGEAWQTPALLNGWTTPGAASQAPGYRKTPWGEVQMRGTVKDGTMTNGTVILILPEGYRPAKERSCLGVQGGICRGKR